MDPGRRPPRTARRRRDPMAKGLLQNRHFITDYVRRHGPVSRFDLARQFEMNASTVGNIVDGLLAEGLLVETGEVRPHPASGRPPILLRVHPGAGRFGGVDVYRGGIAGVVTDFAGTVLARRTQPLGPGSRRATVLRGIEGLLRELLAETATAGVLRAIGIGLPGLVDRETGVGLRYRPIADWRCVPVGELLEGTFAVPAFVDHNSNCVALGEACLGDGSRYDHVVALLLRTGVSVGVVRHREIICQSSLGEGELGHTTIRVNGARCWCGARGCLEAYASGHALLQRVQSLARRDPTWPGVAVLPTGTQSFDPSAVCQLAKAGDERAEAMLREMFRYLGTGVNTVARLLAPDALVVHGSFAAAGDWLIEEVRGVMGAAIQHPARLPDIIVSGADASIGAAGAALMAASLTINRVHRLTGPPRRR